MNKPPRTPVPTAAIFLWLCASVCFLQTAIADSPAEPPLLRGTWVLNDDSDEPKEAFKGKMRKSRYPVPQKPTNNRNPSIYDGAQANYWETIRGGKERKSIKDLTRLGSAYPLVTANSLAISVVESGYDFVYDDVLPRLVRPNPSGRIFSAKGDELVEDTFGFTLAYWEKQVLVLETDPPSGGKIVEKIKMLNDDKLEYSIRVKSLVLKEPVAIRRIFDKSN
jgi:hypothetical protein